MSSLYGDDKSDALVNGSGYRIVNRVGTPFKVEASIQLAKPCDISDGRNLRNESVFFSFQFSPTSDMLVYHPRPFLYPSLNVGRFLINAPEFFQISYLSRFRDGNALYETAEM